MNPQSPNDTPPVPKSLVIVLLISFAWSLAVFLFASWQFIAWIFR